ncbi:MAG: sigma-70 family RNA polymerase sigma factor [Terriglobia bacterium]
MLKFSGVTNPDGQDITAMLAAWNGGDGQALDRLMEIVYPELRRVARQYLAGRRPGDSLESAALANEAYLKLVRSGGIQCENKAHFLALCSQIIRRILVDHARRRGFAKHGGKALRVSLDDVTLAVEERGVELLALDRALDELARIEARKSRVVELRYFGGLSIEETAAVLNVSIDTAKRDWRMAKAWLISQL